MLTELGPKGLQLSMDAVRAMHLSLDHQETSQGCAGTGYCDNESKEGRDFAVTLHSLSERVRGEVSIHFVPNLILEHSNNIFITGSGIMC